MKTVFAFILILNSANAFADKSIQLKADLDGCYFMKDISDVVNASVNEQAGCNVVNSNADLTLTFNCSYLDAGFAVASTKLLSITVTDNASGKVLTDEKDKRWALMPGSKASLKKLIAKHLNCNP